MNSLISIILVLFLASCSLLEPNSSYRVEKAETLAKQKEYQKAVAEYQRHFEKRVNDKSKPKNENPYFYYILIGDVYLEQGEMVQAEESYLVAKNNKVSKRLVLDRLRQLIREYEKSGSHQKAILLIDRHYEFDPEFFDIDLDRVNKAIVSKEDA